jgi:hypothetical protein
MTLLSLPHAKTSLILAALSSMPPFISASLQHDHRTCSNQRMALHKRRILTKMLVQRKNSSTTTQYQHYFASYKPWLLDPRLQFAGSTPRPRLSVNSPTKLWKRIETRLRRPLRQPTYRDCMRPKPLHFLGLSLRQPQCPSFSLIPERTEWDIAPTPNRSTLRFAPVCSGVE